MHVYRCRGEGSGHAIVCLLFEPVIGQGGVLFHRGSGMSTALSLILLHGQGMGFIVQLISL